MATIAALSVDIGGDNSGLKKALNDSNSSLNTFSNNVNKSGGNMNNTFSKLGSSIAGAFSVGALIAFGKQIFDVTSEFQKLGAVLANTLGSASEGQIAFAQIQAFAAKTNFSVLELTQSFTALANRGIRATTTNMQSIADVANALGKPLDDVVQAILDVTNSERWNELGIKVKKAGDTITATFRGQTVTAKATEQGALDLVTAIGKFEGVAGSTTAVSQTLSGATSNLGDAMNTLFAAIGGKGSQVISEFIQGLTTTASAITRLITSSQELKQQAFLGELGKEADKLKERIDALTKTNEGLGVANARNAAITQILADATANLSQLQKEQAANSEAAKEATSDTIETFREKDTVLSNGILLEQKRIAVLNEMTAKTNAVNSSTLGLIGSLEAQIKAQDELNKKATDTKVLAAGQAAVKNLNDQLDALQKLGTQNSLEVVTDKLEKYYAILGNPDSTDAMVANAAKQIRALESVREELQNNIDATVKLFNIPVPESLKNINRNSANPSQSLTSNDTGTVAERKAIADSFKPLNIQLIDPENFLSEEALAKIRTKFKDLEIIMNEDGAGIVDATDSLRSGLVGAFSNLGELLGDALTGSLDTVGSAVSRIGSLIAGFMKAVGSSLIAAGVAKIAFDNLKVSGPAAVVAGIALIAASAVVSQLISSPPKLATGTNYFPSDGLAYLHKGEAVIPKKFNPYVNGGSMTGGWGGTVEFVIQGETLKGVLRNYDKGSDRRG